jgi:hypothetical protein
MLLRIVMINILLAIGSSLLRAQTCNLPCERTLKMASDNSGFDRGCSNPMQELPGNDLQDASSLFAQTQPHSSPAQTSDSSVDPRQAGEVRGSISGTVTDSSGDVIPGAEVVLTGPDPSKRRTLIADQNGFFEFQDMDPGDGYRVAVSAAGFTDWKSQSLQISPGQFLILDNVALKLDAGSVSVTVTASPVEIAAEQVRIAEHQRVLGFIPNYLVVYDGDPAPLTPKLKFRLAFRVATDPVTFIGVAGFAAINQAARTPDYVEGWKGYGQRAGALYADGFTDLMLGGAILPSLLHQDPRYIYKGKGSTKSRLLRALLSPFWCRSDNGKWQVNYSSLGGNLASTAISEAYYPSSNRGPGLVFGNFAIGTGERVVSGLAQEFLLRKLTPGAAKNANH